MQRTLQRELKVPEASAGTAEIDAVIAEFEAIGPAEGVCLCEHSSRVPPAVAPWSLLVNQATLGQPLG